MRKYLYTSRAVLLGAGWIFSISAFFGQQASRRTPPSLPRQALAQRAFGNDAPWYLDNIPFLEIDDPAIEETYYYRWKVYHSHMRDLGQEGNDVTEFLPSVSWARHPYEDLNDSSSFHILEGRWLRNPSYVKGLVDHLYSGAGNDRHFSESIAAATFAGTQVTGDASSALRHLDAMQAFYNLWDDHFDASRNLYWIEPILDATEYTISSIDASGAGFNEHPDPKSDGFNGGFAFRPSINSFQYGNARAIAELAHVAGLPRVEERYSRRADNLRASVVAQLWSPALLHFIDIYQRSTPTVKAGDTIRGRELVGLVPWQFDLPPANAAHSLAAGWRHALGPSELGGAFGLRTVEPSYPRYMVQYRYDRATGRPECQWNGPAWPFQSSQALTGMANLLDDYAPEVARDAGITATDYLHLLRQYTQLHRDGSRLDLQEDYNPDTGSVIVGLNRSHHYLHSTYNDLILSGLIGIRPRTDNVLEIQPLLPPARSSQKPIRYFALQGLQYHGHELTIVYDADGTRYHLGAGLSVFSDGKALALASPRKHLQIPLAPKPPSPDASLPLNLAVNVWGRPPSAFEPDLPIASASSLATDSASATLYEPIDGRQWFFPEIAHGWSPATQNPPTGSDNWYAVDLRHPVLAASVELAFFEQESRFVAPAAVRLQARIAGGWQDIAQEQRHAILPNGVTRISFKPVRTQEVRILFASSVLPARLISFKLFEPEAFSRLPRSAPIGHAASRNLSSRQQHHGVLQTQGENNEKQ